MTTIELKQLPVISHELKQIGLNVTKRLEQLNLDKLIATDETLQYLKKTRAELNKELKEFEDQRKAVKTAIFNPYDMFEIEYKTEISNKYGDADNLLKTKISEVEIKAKDAKKAAIVAYFTELCAAESIDFLIFDRLGIEINLSTTEKAYKEKVNEIVMKTIDDLSLIKTTEHEAETLVEYKKSLNVSQAITTVKARKDAEKQEAERIKQQGIINRKTALSKLGFTFDEFSQSYVYNEGIFMTLANLEAATSDEFTTTHVRFTEEIRALKSEEAKAEAPATVQQTTPVKQPEPAPVTAAPIHPPVVVEPTPETVTASFEVVCSMPKLKALGQYMRDNNITYKNI